VPIDLIALGFGPLLAAAALNRWPNLKRSFVSNFHCKLVTKKGLVFSGLAHIEPMSLNLILTLASRFNDIARPARPKMTLSLGLFID
jgi:hypothetical protein